jgi:hypothetical protein
MTVFGLGDAILKFPGLIEKPEPGLMPSWARDMPYIAVHLGASDQRKLPPEPQLLERKLEEAEVNTVYVGTEYLDLPHPNDLRVHIDAVSDARGFIGTLSAFNCVAQIMRVPSFVFVNMSIKDPKIYDLMAKNQARVCPWNTGQYPIGQLYDEAVEWAKNLLA